MNVYIERRRFKIKQKCKEWLGSAAGRISLLLFIISLLMLIIACSSWDATSERAASNINNILFGISTNLLGIIVTVSFVQYFIDKQNEKQARQEEATLIKRYDRFMEVLIRRYLMYFHCVTTPMDKRQNENPLELKNDFNFEDMCDLYEQSLYTCEGIFEPSIVFFYKAEEKLRNYIIDMVENIDFKYNEELLQILMCFVESSIEHDMRGAILGNINTQSGGEKLTKTISKYIKDSSHQWVEKGKRGELSANLMLPYVQLYQVLKIEIDLLIQYNEYLRELK